MRFLHPRTLLISLPPPWGGKAARARAWQLPAGCIPIRQRVGGRTRSYAEGYPRCGYPSLLGVCIERTSSLLGRFSVYADQRIGELLRELPTKPRNQYTDALSSVQDKPTKTEALQDAGRVRKRTSLCAISGRGRLTKRFPSRSFTCVLALISAHGLLAVI